MSAESSFFVTGGTIPRDAPSYIVREADADLLEHLRKGEFCYVLNTRQMGKSSLSVRTLAALQEQGARTAFLDLTRFGGQNVTPEQWYLGLLAEAGRQLGLRSEFLGYWKANAEFSFVQRFFGALTEVALATNEDPLVVFVDEIDASLSLMFPVDEFFAALRECYNRRTQDPALYRMTFCLLGVATPADLISDLRMSPFNIGKRIVLTDFTATEAATLATRLAGGKAVLDRVLYWTGGHPYLTQRLCRAIADAPSVVRSADVDRLCDSLFLSQSARDSDDNLSFVRNRLLRSEVDLASLLDLYAKIRSGQRVPDDETNPLVPVLRLSGVCRVEERGFLRVRNRIYDRVFDRQWVETHMPDAELRRQRDAYRRGVMRTGLLASVVILVMAALTGWAFSERQKAADKGREAEKNARVALTNAKATAAALDRSRRSAEEARTQAKRANSATNRALENEKAARRAMLAAEKAQKNTDKALAGQKLLTAKAREARRAATIAAQQSEQLTYLAKMGLIQREWDANNIAHVQEILTSPTVRKSPNRSFEWGYWHAAFRRNETVQEVGYSVYDMALSPEGRRAYTVGNSSRLSVWDTMTGKPIKVLEFPRKAQVLSSVAVSPDGTRVAVINGSGTIAVWDTTTWQLAGEPWKAHNTVTESIRFSPDGTALLTASWDRTCRIWNVRTGEQIGLLRSPSGSVRWATYSPDGKTIAAAIDNAQLSYTPEGTKRVPGTGPACVQLWNAKTGEPEGEPIKDFSAVPYFVNFTPDSTRFVTCGMDSTVSLWETQTRRQQVTLGRNALDPSSGDRTVTHQQQGHIGTVFMAQFSPDGRLLATSGDDKTIRLWETGSGKQVSVLRGHLASVTALQFTQEGSHVLSTSRDNTMRLWEVSLARRAIPRAAGDTRAVSPNGRLLVAQKPGETPWVWEETRALFPLPGHTKAILAVAFSPDGRHIASGGEDGLVVISDAQSGRIEQTFVSTIGPVDVLAFSPESTRLLTSSASGSQLWSVATGKPLWNKPALFRGALVVWAPNGKYIALSKRPLLRVISADKGEICFQQSVQQGGKGIAYSPDSRYIAFNDANGANHIVDVVLRHSHSQTVNNSNSPLGLYAFSPDGTRLAGAQEDGRIQVWDCASGSELLAFTEPTSAPVKLTFSPDGRKLLAWSQMGEKYTWSSASEQTIARWEASEREAALRRQRDDLQRILESTQVYANPHWLADVRAGRLHGDLKAEGPSLLHTNGWTFHTNAKVADVRAAFHRDSETEMRIEVTRSTDVSFDAELNYKNLSLVPGKHYALQFRARADRPRTLVELQVRKSSPPFNGVGLDTQRLPLNTTWRAFTYPFVAGEGAGAGGATLAFRVARETGIFWLADVILVPVREVGKGSSQENLLGAWTPLIDTTTATRAKIVESASGLWKVDVIQPGTQTFHVQLFQKGLNLKPGQRYVASFRARASVERSLMLGIARDSGNFASVARYTDFPDTGYLELPLSTSWKTFSLPFIVNDLAEANHTAFSFLLGKESGTVWIERVQLTVAPETK